jgi:hypothetical protein
MKRSVFQILPPESAPPPPEPLPPFPEDPQLRERLERILSGQDPPPTMTHPPEVLEMLDKVLALHPDIAITPETRQRMLDDWALMYHHGGEYVLTWQSPQGLAVLAVGMEENARALQHIPTERWLDLLEQFAEPWWE